ncbi:MAG: HIT domain-containing protein [Actinomycetes bacterium]
MEVTADPECLFCRIVSGQVPATIERSTPVAVVFRDVRPVAPTHLLVIPRVHRRDLSDLVARSPGLVGELVATADMAASAAGLTGYRMVVNNGASAGQTVFHVHLHVLGGRPMTWPPG